MNGADVIWSKRGECRGLLEGSVCDVKKRIRELHEVTREKCMDCEGGHTRGIRFV